MKRKKNEVAFILHHNDSAIAIMYFMRKSVVAEAEWNYRRPWSELKKDGYHIKKIELVPVKGKKNEVVKRD